jgi:serine/threonine protein kinase
VERQATDDAWLGSEVAGYRIEAAIGRGGMSRVYRAEDLRLGRLVALKLLGPKLADDALFRARFEREWRLAATLRHPHIIPIFNAGDEDGVLYIAMLLVEGGDLSSLLRRRGAMDPTRALDVLGQVASALDAAHGQRLIHRDLKPSNVLLSTGRAADESDHAYLADFGLTKSVSSDTQLTLAGSFLGTPGYTAPEQIAGRTVDMRADVYALGCMLFECLTGSVPFKRDSDMAAISAHLSEPPPSASALRPGLPAAIDSVIERALAKRPEERFSTAPDLINAASAVVASTSAPTVALTSGESFGLPQSPPTPRGLSSTATQVDSATPYPRARRRRPRRALIGPIVSIAAILLVAGAVTAQLVPGLFDRPNSPSAAFATPSHEPSQSPSSSLASPSSSSSQYFAGATAGELYLLERAPPALAAGCRRYEKRPTDSEVRGSVAAINCPVVDPDVSEALYFRFPSSDSLASWWRERIRAAKLQPDSAGCAGGRQGETSYEGGRLLCYVSSREGRLRWLDEGALIYGVVNARTDRTAKILQWWIQSHAARGIQAEPLFSSIEQGLVAYAPADIVDRCIPYRIVAKGDTPVVGDVGAIDCLVDSRLVEDVGYFEFPTLKGLEEWWRDRMAKQKIESDSGGCVDGTIGETATTRGRIACYVAGGDAFIRWIDTSRLVYGTLNGVTDDLTSLYRWWDARQ